MSNMSKVISSAVCSDGECWYLGRGVFIQATLDDGRTPCYGVWYGYMRRGGSGPCWVVFRGTPHWNTNTSRAYGGMMQKAAKQHFIMQNNTGGPDEQRAQNAMPRRYTPA